MRKKVLWVMAPLAASLLLASCGSSHSPDLIVDDDPNSCSALSSNGAPVVVGSGVSGDPAAPEKASGYRLGLTAKYSSKYMVVANTPLATKSPEAVVVSAKPIRLP